MTTTHIGTPLVVVGVDGSDCSLDALRFAVSEARRRGASLRIVSAWSIPAMAYAGGYMSAIDPGLFRRDSEAVSTDAVKEARKLDPDLVVEGVVSNQHAAAALISAAEGADVLVVGSRGHGGFARLVLGSVSEQLAHHAPCPLTIVRPGTSQ